MQTKGGGGGPGWLGGLGPGGLLVLGALAWRGLVLVVLRARLPGGGGAGDRLLGVVANAGLIELMDVSKTSGFGSRHERSVAGLTRRGEDYLADAQ